MTATTLTYQPPALSSPFDATKANVSSPSPSQMANGFIPSVDKINAEQQNYLHNASTTILWQMQQLGLFVPFNPVAGASVVATPKGGIVSIKASGSGDTQFYVALNAMPSGYTDPSLDPTNWQLINFGELAKYGAITVTLSSASTVNIGAALSANIRITGTTTITAFDTVPAGILRYVLYIDATPITHNAAIDLIGGMSRINSYSDVSIFISLGSGNWREVSYSGMNPAYDTRYSSGMYPFNVTQSSNLLDATLGVCTIDFRNLSLTTGTPVNYNVASQISFAMTNIAGSLGATTAIKTRLVYALVYAAGTPQIAVANISGGLQMDETNLITTSAIGAGSTSATTWYSTSAIPTPSQYTIIGICDATWTSGTGWATPVLVQPAGGNAQIAMNSIGYGQSWQDLTGSRSMSTTYYNTEGKAIVVQLWGSTNSTGIAINLIVNGITICSNAGPANTACPVQGIIPPGGSYSATQTGTTFALTQWNEFK